MNETEFLKLRDFVYKKTGISIDEKKFNILSRKIEKLMKKYNFHDFRSFFHVLRFQKDNNLLQDVINTVTVNETYFFRENYQFETLVNYVLPELHKIRPKNEVIRILSAPCSTGEEPYSIAIHILEEANIVEKRDIEIIGVDIDSVVLEKAKKGIYSERSVQFLPPHILKKYFKKVGNFYEIDKSLREAITFKKVNVMDKFQVRRLGKVDVIFSRNMLIYFDKNSRKEIAMTFYEILKSEGYIFLGHAESMNRIVSVFKTVKLGDSIFYQKS